MSKFWVVCLTAYLVIITMAAALFGFLFFKGDQKEDIVLTKQQCKIVLDATLDSLVAHGASSSSLGVNRLAEEIPNSEFVDWKQVDTGGVGIALGHSLSLAAVSSLVKMHLEEEYEPRDVIGGTAVIGQQETTVRLVASGKNNVVSGKVQLAVNGMSTYAYYVEFQIAFSFEDYEILSYDFVVFDNNAENCGEILWCLRQDENGNLLGLSRNYKKYDSIKADAKSNGNKFFNMTIEKSGYDFSTEFTDALAGAGLL